VSRIVKRQTVRLFRVGLCAAVVSAPAHAGSYMRSSEELSYSTSLGYTWATRRWNESRDLESAGCRRDYAYSSHYVEYGYSYYHTLFGGALLANASCDDERHAGFGDLRLGVRGRTDLYRNHRAWELVATIPTERGDASPRLDCGAHGLRGALARKDEVLPRISLGSGLGVQLWEGPLAHELDLDLSLSGPLKIGRLRWGVDLEGAAPLEGGGAASGDISDCGTRGKRVKAGVSLGASVARDTYVDCGYVRAVWGEDATLSQGFSCGFSRTWD
jgi:hypothetical protein